MASISHRPNGTRSLQFYTADNIRRTVHLGKLSKHNAESVKAKVETILAAKAAGCALDAETARWIGKLEDDLHARLARHGLFDARKALPSSLLGEFLKTYIESRLAIKPRTRINLEACSTRLTEYFGADRPLRDIKPGHADDWAQWLRSRYATATASRTIRRAKQFFEGALDKELIAANPFKKIKPGDQSNKAREFNVTREMAEKVLAACPDAEWRAIFALCRFGGLRCPSEVLLVTWQDVDWERGRLLVHSPKTEHHKDGAERWVPLFPELRQHLGELFDLAEEGATFAIVRYREINQNLRTQFERIIRRAGLSPWPRLFQNLRASRQTELANEHPLHVACAWIGNKAAVAAKHYLQVTDADFTRAAAARSESRAADERQKALHMRCDPASPTAADKLPSVPARFGRERNDSPQVESSYRIREDDSHPDGNRRESKMPRVGLETSQNSQQITPFSELSENTAAPALPSGEVSTGQDRKVAEVVAALRTLPGAVLDDVLAALRAAQASGERDASQ